MRKSTFSGLLFCTFLSIVGLQSCKDDSYLMTPPPIADQSFGEEFDTVAVSLNRGWVTRNVSEPKGPNVWQQGGDVNPWFAPFSSSGSYAGFIGADYTSTSAAQGIISNWLISPVITMQNGDKIVFHTRGLIYAASATDSTDYANRMQVRINAMNDGTNVGSGADAGDFKITLLDINPFYVEYHTNPAMYDPTAYPARWTRFEATVSGLNNPVKGRFAFRYFVTDAGSNGRASE
jgi:hypothetical protein